MPIKKETSSRLVKFGYNFESVPRQIVEQITNPDALAYYVYLLTRPDNWVVRRNHLREHFNGLSLARHNAAMRVLRGMGLVWTQTEKRVDGTFSENIIMCGAIPVDDLPSPKVQIADHRENPSIGKTGDTVNRPLKDRHINKDIQIKDKDIQIRGWGEWVEYRKEIKKKMTPATIKKQVKFLEAFDPKTQQAIINQSIQNGWAGLFELKEQNHGKPKRGAIKEVSVSGGNGIREISIN